MEKKLYLYTDESGNSGENIFDKNQPFFWTGTIVSEFDFDKKYKEQISQICSSANCEELHANEMGVAKINDISKHLQNIINDPKVKILYCRVEKAFALKVKFFDYFFDPGINKAVSYAHYNFRGLRTPLVYYFASLITEEDAKEFWGIYENCDAAKYENLFSRLICNISSSKYFEENNITYDKRANELIIDAMKWAGRNPEGFLIQKRGKLDLPNMICMGMLGSGLNNVFPGAEIQCFVHDKQDSYGKYLKEIYEHTNKLVPEYKLNSNILDTGVIENKSTLEICDSKDSAALQVIDVLLWIIKRHIDSEQEYRGDVNKLVKSLMKKAVKLEMSKDSYAYEIQEILKYPLPHDTETLRVVNEMYATMENSRKERMNEENHEE